jgi:hypothetical protein
MKLHSKYGQSMKFGATVEVLDNCYLLEKEVKALASFSISSIEKQDEK